MCNLFALLFALVSVGGTTYYVSPIGNDTNPGNFYKPWRTIKHSTFQVEAGDTVVIKAGTYYESEIAFTVDGEKQREIVFKGELDKKGRPLSIINGATVDTSGQWVHEPMFDDPEDPSVKVYQNTELDYKPQALIINGKSVLDIGKKWFPNSQITCFTEKGWTGMDMLRFRRDKVISVREGTYKFWETIHALYGWDPDTETLYLRLRDGEDPNNFKVRVAPKHSYYCMVLRERNHIKIENLKLMGCDRGIIVQERNGNEASNIMIDNCEISYSTSDGILIIDAEDIKITNNIIYMNLYGRNQFGVWGYAKTLLSDRRLEGSKYAYNYSKYNLLKCVVENGSTESMGISLRGGNDGFHIEGNVIRDGRVGINITDSDNGVIKSNEIFNHSSVGILPMKFSHNVVIHNNLIYNNNINMRIHHMHQSAQDRSFYIYGNRCWNPEGVGTHLYFHLYREEGPLLKPGTVIFENNLFYGGRMGISISSYAITQGGMPQVSFRYNVFSAKQGTYVARDFYTTEGMLGIVDCNAFYNSWHVSAPDNPEEACPWWGPDNTPQDKYGNFAPNTFDKHYPWFLKREPHWEIAPYTFNNACRCRDCILQ